MEPEKRVGLSELGEEREIGLQNILSPQSREVMGWVLLGRWESPLPPGKAFHTKSALKVRNKGVFLGPVLGWEVT